MPPALSRPVRTDAIRQAATGVFSFSSLRPGQLEVIHDVLEGRPVVTVMPTGAGKSLCYQLPAVMLGAQGGVTLVVSPLIALMKDQVDSLRARGIEAAALTSAAGPEEQADILAGIRGNVYTLVYVAPCGGSRDRVGLPGAERREAEVLVQRAVQGGLVHGGARG